VGRTMNLLTPADVQYIQNIVLRKDSNKKHTRFHLFWARLEQVGTDRGRAMEYYNNNREKIDAYQKEYRSRPEVKARERKRRRDLRNAKNFRRILPVLVH